MSDTTTTEKVGYGRPPRGTRFKAGQSGNPSGRPKGSVSLKDDLDAELGEVIQVTEGGRTRHFSKRRLVIKALFNRAMKGDVRAATELFSLQLKAHAAPDERASKPLEAADAAILDEILARLTAEKDGSR